MTRTHRAVHRVIWPVIAVTVGVAFVMALVLRPPPETPATSAPQETRN
jgi:hypothetical protein